MGIVNLLLGSPALGRPLGFKFNLNFNSKATQSGVVESKVTPSAPAFNHLLSLFLFFFSSHGTAHKHSHTPFVPQTTTQVTGGGSGR